VTRPAGIGRRTRPASLLLAAIAAATACGAPSRVVFSTRATDADTGPRRVFVLSRLSETGRPGFGPVFAKAFEGRFDAALRRCGMQTGGASATGLEPASELDRAASEYRPDAVVILRMSHGTVDQHGVLLDGMIEITLFGGTIAPDGTKPPRQPPKALWKGAATFAYGNLGFTAMAAKAEAFADDLSNKLKEDGFFPGCARVGPRDLPAVASPIDASRYAPSSELSAHGGLVVSAASYLPAEVAEARSLQAQAVPSSAVNVVPLVRPRFGPDRDQLAGEGRTRFTPGVGEYVRTGLGAELRKMGIDTARPQRALRVEIQEATADPSGWGYRVSLRVKYELVEAGSGRVLYSAVKSALPSSTTPAMLEVEALDRAIRASAEALVRDPEFAAAIR
jgi:hypothetical protein